MDQKNKIPKVLVVDDDEDMLVLIQHKLLAEGFDPIFAPNGVNVIEIVAAKKPDLVLLDIRMNGVDGEDICREIKLNPETSSIPIIMFSANQNIKAVTEECGADGYITKPFDSGKFAKTFKQVLAAATNKS